MEDEWTKLGIRMSIDGKLKGMWWVHYSGNEGFSLFDVESNLVYIANTDEKGKALEIVQNIRKEILTKGLWGNDREVRKFLQTKAR